MRLPAMCGEEGFTGAACVPGTPTFSQLAVQGSPVAMRIPP